MILKIQPARRLQGKIRVPGDKSISHRAVMLGALAEGKTEITGFLRGRDCLNTIRCFRALGVSIRLTEQLVTVQGRGLYGLLEPHNVLNVGNSGTTMRLLAGILSGQPFVSVLTGDASLRNRPMARVAEPLREMGALILGRKGGNMAPLVIRGGSLRPINYVSPVASAQVKSAILLAGLSAEGWTEVTEPAESRNHTELMLAAFGAEIQTKGQTVRVKGRPVLRGREVVVGGDISSAAFFIVAGLIVPNSRIVIEGVGLNYTRDGVLDVLAQMGANIRITDVRTVAGERLGTITAETSELRGTIIAGEIIPRLIDEIPILAVAALFARGSTEIRDAAELKVKESNRIMAMAQGITQLGGKVEELPDGLRIEGGHALRGASCRSYHDHRIAMALAIAGLRAAGETVIMDADAINISFPQFQGTIDLLRGAGSYGN